MPNPLAAIALPLALAVPTDFERVPFKIPDYASVERVAAYATPAE